MFRSRNKPALCPVNEEIRQWLEDSIGWLTQTFGEEMLLSKKVLVPDVSDFPIQYKYDRESAERTLHIVAKQMDINPDELTLNIYSEGETEISTGGALGGRVFINTSESARSGGLYWGRNEEDGKYYIGLESKVLKDPEKIVATLSHELAHVKLLGEGKIEENNEPLTDLLTVVFGLGIFNANAAFQFGQTSNSWYYQSLGYLSQMEWGYALALYAYLRDEQDPSWLKYLNINVKGDFKKGIAFINENEDLIFRGEQEDE